MRFPLSGRAWPGPNVGAMVTGHTLLPLADTHDNISFRCRVNMLPVHRYKEHVNTSTGNERAGKTSNQVHSLLNTMVVINNKFA